MCRNVKTQCIVEPPALNLALGQVSSAKLFGV